LLLLLLPVLLLLLLLLCCQIMGPAMEPTFSGQGDVVLVERLPGMLDRARPGDD
jgi:signal peptidase I